jgi:putative ABC transport system permease protein
MAQPPFWRRIPGNWNYLLRIFARKPEDDVDAELRFHFDERIAALTAQGVPFALARQRAHDEFGDLDGVRTHLHDIGHRIARRRRRADWWERAGQGLKFALRGLRRSPAFTAVAVLSLAVGIGISTATFAMVDSMLNPKIDIANVDRLFREQLRLGNERNPPPIVEQVRALEALPAIERVAVVSQTMERLPVTANFIESYPVVTHATQSFFATIGVVPVLGRLPSDDEVASKSAVVLSASAWRSLFPKHASLEDAVISMDGRDYAVVGVLPAGLTALMYGDVWLTARSAATLDELPLTTIFVRLRAGTDSIAVRPQLAAIAANFSAVYAPPPLPAYELRLHGLRRPPPSLRDDELAVLLIGIAVGVLAIACTNVSALALARGLARRRDYAMRVALGASRLVIGGEVISEVLILALLGAVLGLMLASALVGTLAHMVPEDLTLRGFFVPALTPRVFAMTTLTLVAGILIAGGIPAWRASRANPSDPLKDGAGTTTGRARGEFKVLVIGELSIAMALLMLASLLTMSTHKLMNYDFGFDARRIVTAGIGFPGSRDSLSTAQKEATLQSAIRAVTGMPGVEAVSTLDGHRLEHDEVIADVGSGSAPLILKRGYSEAGPRLFATLGMSLRSGRDFAPGDRERGAVILSERAAALLFPHGDALGRMVKLGGERSTRPWLPVIGIAPDVRASLSPDPYETADTVIYASTPDRSPNFSNLVIRPSRVMPTLNIRIGHTLRDDAPPHSFVSVQPLLARFDQMIRQKQFFERVFSFLSAASVLLGAAGLFSVMSYTVGRRLREFAVRQALGASPRSVLWLVMRGSFELALGGTAFGALLSFWASAGVSTVLFGIKNTDPVSLVIAEATLLTVTMVASLIPAVRAMRADPVDALRAI